MTYPDDEEFVEHVLSSVAVDGDGWLVSVSDGGYLFVQKYNGTPRVGSRARFYGRGFGYPVRGIFIDGVQVRYRTRAQHEQDMRDHAEADDRRLKDEFERDGSELDARVAALPPVFQARIQRFRQANPNFRWKYERYELFCCEQAVLIAETLRIFAALQEFRALSWEEQRQRVPGLDGGHSGNTFGIACRLAYWYLTRQDQVVLEHGAMVMLVGCKEYGCEHPEAPS